MSTERTPVFFGNCTEVISYLEPLGLVGNWVHAWLAVGGRRKLAPKLRAQIKRLSDLPSAQKLSLEIDILAIGKLPI